MKVIVKIQPLNNINSYANLDAKRVYPISVRGQNVNATEKLYTITFGGKDKNPNQILMLSAECAPYSDSGGLGSITCDKPKAYMEKYKSKNQDLRVIMPIYNANEKGPKTTMNGIPIFESSTKLDPKTGLPLRFELEDTGIKKVFKFGVNETEARLYKIKEPINGVPTYAVYSPSFSLLPKPYGGSFIKNHAGYSAFSFAVLNLLKEMPEKEGFNPKTLHTNDWSTNFAINILKDMSKRDDFYKEIKTLYEVHLASAGTQGKITPFPALLHCFDSEEVKNVLTNYEFAPSIGTLIKSNLPIYLKIRSELMKPGETLDSFLKNDRNMLKTLSLISEGFEKLYFPQISGKSLHENLNTIVRKEFKNVRWDLDDGDFNPSILAADNCDKWLTVSPNHFKELLADNVFSSPSMKNAFNRNKEKGQGILSRIDEKRYDPKNPNQVEFTYSTINAAEAKNKNKLFIAQQLSKKNIEDKKISTKLINDVKNSNIKGFLADVKASNPLLVSVGRFSSFEKGCDILFNSIEPILEAHPEARIVIVAPDCNKHGKAATEELIKKVIENPKHIGKVVLIDSFEAINQYLAGADLFMIPSRTETCCLTQFQAFRMGALPVASPTGGLHDGITTIEENLQEANGFKAKESLMFSKKPVESYVEVINKALNLYKNDEKLFNNLVTQAMEYQSGWVRSIEEHHKVYSLLANSARKVL